MAKVGKDQDYFCPVGVVMRSEAPLIEELLTEKEQINYLIAIDELKPKRRRLPWLGVPFIISILSLLDVFKFTR